MEGPTDFHAVLADEKELTSGCIIVMARGTRQTYMRMQRRAEQSTASRAAAQPAVSRFACKSSDRMPEAACPGSTAAAQSRSAATMRWEALPPVRGSCRRRGFNTEGF